MVISFKHIIFQVNGFIFFSALFAAALMAAFKQHEASIEEEDELAALWWKDR